MVRDWMFRGTCQDMYGEFMLQVNHEYVGRRGKWFCTFLRHVTLLHVFQTVEVDKRQKGRLE